MFLLIVTLLTYSVCLPLGVGIIRWNAHSRVQRILTLALIAEGFNSVIQHLADLYWGTNLVLFHLVAPIEMIFLLLIYKELLKPLHPKKWIYWLGGGFILFCGVDALLIAGATGMPSVSWTLQGFLVTGLSLLFFYLLLRDLHIEKIWRAPAFWVVIGALVYHAGGIFIWVYSDVIRIMSPFSIASQGINTSLLVAKYSFYTVSLLCKEHPNNYSKVS